MRSFSRYLAAAFLAAAIPHESHAQVYKCPGDDGEVKYQEKPCPGGYLVTGSKAGGPLLAERVMICMGQSAILQEAIERLRGSNQDFAAQRRIDEIRPVYVRDCSPFGYRIPDTRANIAHNRTLASDSGPPIPTLAGSGCRQQESAVRIGIEHARRGNETEISRKMLENQTRDYVRDCSRYGYKIPDNAENIAHNQAIATKMEQDFETQLQRRKAWEAQQLR